MGFALNLALSLHTKDAHLRIRFFCDNLHLFQKFFQSSTPDWIEYISLETWEQETCVAPSELIFSFFDYQIPKEYLFQFPYQKTIVVFSYFLLHKGLESLHNTTYVLESGYDRVIHIVPSLLPGWGGIIINPEIERQRYWIKKIQKHEKWISVFVYADTLKHIVPLIQKDASGTIFWIFDTGEWLQETPNCRICPFMTLEEFGVFQSLCDANIVRWENSLCQGLISGKPVLWDIYKEENSAHVDKIEDYLRFLSHELPDTDWSKYARMMRDFNTHDTGWRAFVDFISGYYQYDNAFRVVSEYIKKECDLLEKLEII